MKTYEGPIYLKTKDLVVLSSLVCISLLFSACIPHAVVTETALPATVLPTLVATPFPSQSQPTASLTPMPLPSLPVLFSTPFPLPVIPFSAKNGAELASIQELAHYGLMVREAVLSADGNTLYLGTAEGIKVYDLGKQNTPSTTTLVRTMNDIIVRKTTTWSKVLPGEVQVDHTLTVSADGSRMAVTTYEGGVVIDTMIGAAIMQLPGSAEVAISPDGASVATVKCLPNATSVTLECNFEVLSVPDGKLIFTWHGQKPLFSPNSKYLAVEYGQQVYIFNTSDWTLIQVFMLKISPQGRGYKYFSPDGELIALCMESFIDIRRVVDTNIVREIQDFNKAFGVSPSLTFSPGGSTVAILDANNVLAVWDVAKGIKLSSQDGPTRQRSDVRPIILGDDGSVTILELPEPAGVNLAAAAGSVKNLAFFSASSDAPKPDSLAVYGGTSCLLKFGSPPDCFDLPSNHTYNQGRIYALRSLDSMTAELRLGMDGSGELLTTLRNYPHTTSKDGFVDLVNIYALAPNRQALFFGTQMLATRRAGYDLQIWDLEAQRFLNFNLPQDFSTISDFIFSSDGQVAAFLIHTNTGDIAVVLDLTKKEFVLWQKVSAPTHIAFVGNDQFAYTQKDIHTGFNTINFMRWDQAQPSNPFPIQGITRPVNILLASPDASLMAVSFSGDGTILLFNIQDGSILSSWPAHESGIDAMTFSADDSMLASSSQDGLVKLWGIPGK